MYLSYNVYRKYMYKFARHITVKGTYLLVVGEVLGRALAKTIHTKDVKVV